MTTESEKNLRKQLLNFENKLENIPSGSKRFQFTLEKYKNIIAMLGDDPEQINNLNDVKEYNNRSQGRKIYFN